MQRTQQLSLIECYRKTIYLDITDAQTFDRRSSDLWTAYVKLSKSEPADCSCNVKHFLISPGNYEFDLKRALYHACNLIINVYYTVQTLVRINTVLSPCMSTINAINCEKACIDAKILERNITCKLPFMASVSLPLCNDSNSAKQTRQLFIDGYLKTNPMQECGCKRRCTETLFLPTVSHVNEFPNEVTVVKYNVETNIREIIKEQLAFPLEKFLCDVGSNLGILLGSSLISIFQNIGISLSKFKTYLSSRRKM